MLRITELSEDDAPRHLRVEGRITEQTAGELAAEVEAILKRGNPLVVDLAGVHFADAAGAGLLRECERRGAVLIGCSGLLSEMMGTDVVVSPSVTSEPHDDLAEPLLDGLRRGDGRAFEELVRLYSGRLLALAKRILGSEHDARDAVQDAMVSVFRSIDRFDGSAKLSTWLHRIVVNAALMKLRSQRRRPEESIDDLLPHFDAKGNWQSEPARWLTPGDVLLEQRENRALVRRSIERLPDTLRVVLVLRDIEELDTEEVARLVEITPNAVKIRLHRARQALRTLIEAELVTGGGSPSNHGRRRPAQVVGV
jgi:RNA polymerase sigma-70 factor (ECF subfamily)